VNRRVHRTWLHVLFAFIASGIVACAQDLKLDEEPADAMWNPAPTVTTVSWSHAKPYHWGEQDPRSLQKPRDTTIDMRHLERLPLGPSVMQPFAHAPRTTSFAFATLPDTTIDLHTLRKEPIRFRTSPLGAPIKREVGLPRVRDGAAMSILSYGQEQNLVPGTIVYTCAQDIEGRMWFGTTSGISIFDGVTSYVYGEKQGISSNTVWSFHFNSNGTVWCGGLKGLDLIDVARGLVHHVIGPGWFDSSYVFTMRPTHDGLLLLGLAPAAAILDPKSLTLTKFSSREGLGGPSGRIALEDHAGIYWFGTPNGLTALDPRTGRIHYLDASHGLPESQVKSLDLDSHDRLWIGIGNSGLSILNAERTSLTHLTSDNGLCSNVVKGTVENRDGTYWIGCSTTMGGLTHLDLRNQCSERIRPPDGLAASGITSVFNSEDGDLWFSTWTGGVGTVDCRLGVLHQLGPTQGLSGTLPGAILTDRRGRLWIGSDQGIDILAPANDLSSSHTRSSGTDYREHIPPRQLGLNGQVNGLREDSRGRIWITTTSDGVSVLDPETGRLMGYGMEQGICEYATRRVLEDPKGAIWVASITGVNRLTPIAGHSHAAGYRVQYIDQHHGLGHYANCDFLYVPPADERSSAGHLWIANGAGVDRFDLQTEEIQHLELAKDGHAVAINCLLRDSHGLIWIGTNDEAIYIVDPVRLTMVHLTEADGIRDATVRSLVEFRGDIFAGTRHGLFRITTTHDRSNADDLSDARYAIEEYREADGLCNTDFQSRAVAMGSDSALYWCTATNVLSFQGPGESTGSVANYRLSTQTGAQPRMQPRTQGITQITWVDGPDSNYSAPAPVLRLAYGHSHVTIHFTSNRTTGVSHTEYESYLSSLESGWGSPSHTAYVDYRSIPSGSYTFHVRSRSSSSEPWGSSTMLSITVTPPWYASVWAYILYAVTGGLVVVGSVRYRHRSLLARQDLLEHMVASRTSDLARQKERAEHSERAKEAFLANMSHEIRTPMNAVMGLTDLLLGGDPLPEQRAYLEHIHRSSESLLVILNDILDFSRIEAGKIRLEQVPFNVASVLSSVASTVRVKAMEKSLVITTECRSRVEQSAPESQDPSEVPTDLIGDPTRLQQVLLNLAGNAVKFTDQGTVKIRCERIAAAVSEQRSANSDRRSANSAERSALGDERSAINEERLADSDPWEAGGLCYLRFSVEDTGIGMSAEEVSRVFGSFEQASHATTRVYGGTGLGLSISKQLVELMGGSLEVTSVAGIGSTFSFTLGLRIAHGRVAVAELVEADGHSFVENAHAPVSTYTSGLPAELHGLRVLLAEDNELNRLVARDSLRQALPDITIVDVQNGEEAIDALRAGRFDVVLMDVHMPVLDGYEASSRIRTQLEPPACDTPIIALTAAVIRSEIEKCTAYGMNAYVAKPYRAETLIRTITQVLRGDTIGFPEGRATGDDRITNALTSGHFSNAHGFVNALDDDRSIASYEFAPAGGILTDMTKLVAMTGGDETAARRYVGLFISSTPSQLDILERAFRIPEKQTSNRGLLPGELSERSSVEIDLTLAASIVHQMKSHLKLLGLSVTAEIAEEIEYRLAHGDPDHVLPALVEQLTKDCRRAVAELERHVSG
jgi:signal transduction histidine kinase/ligand-binding sensor domain-containing protein/CheY-like chemotaxis protein/HPt (histidine-containing phosphotransfer) domain-containing protein